MTNPAEDQAAAAVIHKAADDAMSAMAFALEQHAHRYADLPISAAIRAMMVDFMSDAEQDRSNLAAAASILAVMSDRGLVGQPAGMLAVPARVVIYALLALDDVTCYGDEGCPGVDNPTEAGVGMCRRCEALAGLREFTGLYGDLDGAQVDQMTEQLAAAAARADKTDGYDVASAEARAGRRGLLDSGPHAPER
jgi:hypothetical protein